MSEVKPVRERPVPVAPVLVASVAEVARVGESDRLTEKLKPRESVLALEMLVAGHGYEQVREKTGLGFDAIIGLKGRHPVALDVRRQQLAAEGWTVAEGLRQLMLKKMAMLADDDEALAKVSLKDLSVAKAVEQDKAFAALGERPVSVVEHRRGPNLEDAMAAIKAAKEAAREALQKEALPI